MKNTITTRHDPQWRRYVSKFGQCCISKSNRGLVAFIPCHTPHVSVDVTRARAAAGLRAWRTIAREAKTKAHGQN